MRLVASLIVKDEMKRLLPLTVAHLQTYVDEIRALDDGSTDGTFEFLQERGVSVIRNDGPGFYEHEGRARNRLLDFTLQARPTHILAIDADELAVVDRTKLAHGDVWTLEMNEVWKAGENQMLVRADGGWRPHPIPILYRPQRGYRIRDRKLACGREPEQIVRLYRRAQPAGAVLHLGWANEATRAERYQRYVEHDQGNFHQRRHLDSIMWNDRRVRLVSKAWPESLLPYRDAILDRVGATPERRP